MIDGPLSLMRPRGILISRLSLERKGVMTMTPEAVAID